MAAKVPKFGATAVQMITNMLNAIAAKIPAMAKAAVNLIVAFIGAITSSTVKVVSAAIHMVISMINGIANTIRQQTPALKSAMHNLGDAMVTAIVAAIEGLAGSIAGALISAVKGAVQAAKNWLKSLSPSKRTRDELGIPMAQGIAVGINKAGGDISDAMVNVAGTAIDSVKKTLSGMSKVVSDNIDIQPKITPVIDLTNVKEGLGAISGISGTIPIKANISASSAASISAANAAAATQAGLLAGGSSQVVFNQTNTSPVALDAITIYRQTRNQLSIAKGVLTGANTG
jgi:hypothetical protein